MASIAFSSNKPMTTSYSNIALASSGKKGLLKELDNGYFEIILGAFAAFGNGGWLYDERTALEYINNDREFLNMIQGGRLRSEWGHPRRLPGMSDQDWFTRICEIYEPNISSHIRRIRTSMDTVKDERGRMVVAIIGEVRPSGPKAQEFRDWLTNPDEDVNYSIRSFARKDFGTMRKHITKIITWDSVFDPGIAVASKYKTPSLESKSAVGGILDEVEFNLERLKQGIHVPMNDASFENMPHVQVLNALYEDTRRHFTMPRSLQW